MTTPAEEVRALRYTRDFLRALLDPAQTPRVPKVTRKWAANCLRHYPFQFHITERWKDDVCEHECDRRFCRECNS